MLKITKAKGITLIALIITIVVLLILAGVSIATLTGDNGLLNKAQEAKIENDKAGKKEKLQVEIMGSYGTDGKIDIEQLNKNLKELGVENADITKLPAKIEIEEDAYVITGNGNIKDLITMTEAQSDSMLANTENMAVEDDYGNIIILPAGVKITKDTTKVTEGIVIEDNDIVEYEDGTKSTGNQFVWVPVGKIYTTADEATKESTAKTINLSRYEFADGTSSYTANDGTSLGVLAKGTPIDRGSSAIVNSFYSYYTHTEDTTEGDNTHAINITDFKNKTNVAGGYYIARYEASYGADGKANSKVSVGTPTETYDEPTEEGQLWNNINQPDAATASRKMYEGKTTFTSDLVNSYAWDTAIVFIQTFGGEEYKTYSRQSSKNDELANTGVNGDNPLNISDMASNTRELTTEISNIPGYPVTFRGGSYDSAFYTANRPFNLLKSSYNLTFRSLLYVQN